MIVWGISDDKGTLPTVLVVDDEPYVREATARIIRYAGYATVEAVDGREAWHYLQRSDITIDVVVSDVVMPRLTGTELAALLRETRPDLPVLLMTGYDPGDLRARGMEELSIPLLPKPFDPDHLVSLIEQLLNDGSS